MAGDDRAAFESGARLFGQRFEHQRSVLDLSIEEVAATAGLSVDYVERVGSGTVDPTLDTMMELAEAVGVQVWDLLGPP